MCLSSCSRFSTDAELKGRKVLEQYNIHAPEQLSDLENLPPPMKKVSISVYEFPDLTGAYKPNDTFAVYSKAVSQGADAMVVDALRAAGLGSWFRVLERKGINAVKFERGLAAEALQDDQQRNDLAMKAMQALLNKSKKNNNTGIHVNPNNRMALKGNLSGQKRQVKSTQATSSSVRVTKNNNGKTVVSFPKRMAKLRPSQYILQGGIISYDSDIVTTGAGLRFLNVGAFGETRKDIVTINMRLVDILSGEIILSSTITKGIYSRKLQGSGMNYVSIDRILEAEAGVSYNEPVFEALNMTIQAGVLDLVRQGVKRKLWQYKLPPVPVKKIVQNIKGKAL